MATRILITDGNGWPIYGLDGHHGERHAAQWTAEVLATIKAETGIDGIAVELQPAEGGDAVRRGIIGNLHRLRAELRTLPDGRRELIALNRYPDGSPRDSRAEIGAGRGLTKSQAAATPEAFRGALRVIAAPADIANPRTPIRIRRGRLNVPADQPRTHAEIRHARRAARAAARTPRNP
jgi:hypothetical protein